MMFTRRPKVKSPMMVLSLGSSIFYDTTVGEEAKEQAILIDEESSRSKTTDNLNNEEEAAAMNRAHLRKMSCISRMSWAELGKAKEKLESLTRYQVLLQEAKFEIITSEMRYLDSLNQLKARYMESQEFSQLCTEIEWKTLFGNIDSVKLASEKLLNDLVSQLHEDVMLTGIYPVLRKHASSTLRVYEEYCKNLLNSRDVYFNLLSRNTRWRAALMRIEMECAVHYSLQSFLFQPVQRITRLPLLLSAVSKKLLADNQEYTACKLAINALTQLADRCNRSVGDQYSMPPKLVFKKINGGRYSFKIKKQKLKTDNPRPASWTSYTSWDV